MERATDHRQTSLSSIHHRHEIGASCSGVLKLSKSLLKYFFLLPPVPAPRPSVNRAGAYAGSRACSGLIRAQKDTRHHAAQRCAGQLS